MASIKRFSLAVLAVLMTTALAGGSTASAESTALCEMDESSCTLANQVSHVHEATLSGSKAKLLTTQKINRIYHLHEATVAGNKARLLTALLTIECDVLFLGNASFKFQITGSFTYTNCQASGSSCSVTEENGPSKILVSKESHETAKVTSEILIHVVCGSSFDCSFQSTKLAGTAKGPLLSIQTNGEVTLSEQSVSKEAGGVLCFETAYLDITTTPLEATYITGEPERTELCKEDPGAGAEVCPVIENVSVECDALFLGDVETALASPLAIKGSFTYSNCNNECTAEEENGPSKILVLKEGHETARIIGEGLVHVICSGYVDCSYNGLGLLGTGKGPLLATQKNGEVSLSQQQTVREAGGLLCPKRSDLDITTAPLTAIYISK